MRADRVVSMMLLLERRGRMTSRQLADELGVSRRTVMRDIEALGVAGVPIYSTRGRQGGFHIWEGFRSHLRGITAEEAAALSLLGTEELAAQLGLGDAVGRVRHKIMQALTPELANEMATIEQRFHHDASPWSGEPPSQAIAFFEVAVRRRRVVRTSTPTAAAVELRPLGIVLKAGEWFLVAETDGERRVLRIGDLHSYGTTGARFPYPEDFELRTWWQDGRHLDSVHPVAAEGFAAAPERYEAGRPGYPAAAVSWLCERLGIREGAVVADVAAGTGKLTRALVGSGARVIAVEPVSAMAEMLRSLTPGVEVASATAEALPFADGSIDAITAGQAFHWFDAGRAWTEFRRVLRRDGGVGLVWNVRDRSVDWVDRVWSILDEVEKNAPWRDHDRTSPRAGAGFSPLESATFWHDVSLTRQAMLDRIASVSHVAVLPGPEHDAVLARVAAELPAGETLQVRYRVDAFVTHKQ